MHTNDRPYHCTYRNICNKSFKTKSQLNDHLLKHTKIKKYTCLECNKSFSRKSRLKIHVMIHKNILPFQCNICQKKFREKSYYNFHMKKHLPKCKDICNIINKEINLNNITLNHFDKNDLVMTETNENELCFNENNKCNNSIDSKNSQINNYRFINNNEFFLRDNNDIDNKLTSNPKVFFQHYHYNINNNFNNLDDQSIFINNFNNPFINKNYNLIYNDNPLLYLEKDLCLNQNYNFLNNINEKEIKDIDDLKNIFINNDIYNNNNIFIKDNNEQNRFYDYYNCGNSNEISNHTNRNIDDLYINNFINLNNFEPLFQNNGL